MPRVAVVGMASVYPDADSPSKLWENALAGRRAFRRLPDERMRLADYWNADPAAPDSFYSRNAAVIEGYTFDRVAHRIAAAPTGRPTSRTGWRSTSPAGPWPTRASPTPRGCGANAPASSSATPSPESSPAPT